MSPTGHVINLVLFPLQCIYSVFKNIRRGFSANYGSLLCIALFEKNRNRAVNHLTVWNRPSKCDRHICQVRRSRESLINRWTA
jgi:hypothetical protein